MKMLVLTYSGADPGRLSVLLDGFGLPGHTCFASGRGHGLTGPIAGTRAWPGEVTMCFSVVEDALAGLTAERCRTEPLLPGERLHLAVLPVESFS